MANNPFPDKKYHVIYADPPWRFKTWSEKGMDKSPENHYSTMSLDQICALPVPDIAADNSVLLLWACWPMLESAFQVIEAWGFKYKTCGFSWMKADRYRLFADDNTPFAGMGYWTRANTEPCLLATRGHPRRRAADVRQGMIAERREHSRKPDEMYGRIERLLGGPYIEMFARTRRPGWDAWGNQTDKF